MQTPIVLHPLYAEEPDDLRQLAEHGYDHKCEACSAARDRVYTAMALPRRRRVGLSTDVALPPGGDLAGLKARMRQCAPHGWSTDSESIERVLAGLRAMGGRDE